MDKYKKASRTKLYKKMHLNPKTAKPGELMSKMNHMKHKMTAGSMSGVGRLQKVGDQPSMAHWNPVPSKAPGLKSNVSFPGAGAPSTGTTKNNVMAKSHKKSMCKMCGKSHEKGKHMKSHRKGIKLVPASKGHKPKGAHGRAAVHALGRTKTTGNFARIERARGKGAAIAAYQNALRAHKAGK